MSVNVYKVVALSDKYQSLVLENEKTKWGPGGLEFAGNSQLATWKTPGFRIYNPQLARGDFMSIGPGAVVISEPIPDRLLTILELAGELLPVGTNLPDLSIVNVTECADCLDYTDSEWVRSNDGYAIRAKRLAFARHLIPQSTLFKVATSIQYPQYVRTTLFTHIGAGDPSVEFKSQVEDNGLTGLRFELVWSEGD